jgi:uncharacterized membrane protein
MNTSVNARILQLTRHLRFRPRLASAVVVATLLFVYLSTFLSINRALLLAFNGGAAFFLIAIAITMVRATPDLMRQQAKVQDEGKWTVLALSLAVSGVTLIALYLELHGAKIHSLSDVILASASILLSWLFVATMFALHYAHSFYLKPEPIAGRLIFPGTDQPDYWDFMYFSIVLSMACQVSDVQITDRIVRRTALLHGVVAFFFNVIIIAITVNVVAGVL